MNRLNRPLSLAPLLMLLMTGCGIAASPLATERPATRSQTPPSQTAPSQTAGSPLPADFPGGPVNPSPGADPELERRLPALVGTELMQKLSMNGTQYFAKAGAAANDFRDVLATVGRKPEDFTIALAVSKSVKIGAFRVKGVDSTALLPAYVQAGLHNTPGSSVADDSVAGKSVKKVTIPNQTESLYLYASGDALFFAQASTPALLTEAPSKIA